MKDLILALARRGKTILLSSHLLADVEDVCDRVVIYYGGKIHAMGALRELLATPDSLRITMPALSREAMQRVLDTIRADVVADKVRVDIPTQNLESYFLSVVQKARQSEAATSGATSGSHVAAYLAGNGEGASQSDKVLERLTLPTAAAPEPTVVSIPSPLQAVKAEKLEALTKPSEAATPPPTVVEPAKPVDLSKADEKLSSLLGKPK
jgi:ABC-2 type transport system ATP-binding protein